MTSIGLPVDIHCPSFAIIFLGKSLFSDLSADILRINRRLMKLIVRPDDNPVLLLSSVFSKTVKSVENGKESKLILNSGSEVTHVPTMARFLARNSKPNLYGDDLRCQGEVDHFLRFGQRLNFSRDAPQLNKTLLSRTFLTGQVRSLKNIFNRPKNHWRNN